MQKQEDNIFFILLLWELKCNNEFADLDKL